MDARKVEVSAIPDIVSVAEEECSAVGHVDVDVPVQLGARTFWTLKRITMKKQILISML